MRPLLPALVPCFLLALPASADDAALRKCRELKESTARLACYDALPLAEARSVPRATPAPSRPSAPLATPPAAPPPAPAGAATLPASRPPVATSPQAAPPSKAASLESTFGMENRAPSAELSAVESHIPGTFLGWSQYTTIRLANGQVWQVVDEDSRRMLLQDPKVRVRRGLMGAFYLEFEAHNYAPRVRRLQ